MILRFFRSDPRRAAIDQLHERIAAASRRHALYAALGVPDSLDGRFEALALHMILVVRRLGRLPPPADEVSQELVDSIFSHLDVALREMGVGDLTVPKRIKTLAASFYGRVQAYGRPLDAGDAGALAEAIGRNVTGDATNAQRLSAYAIEAEALLEGQDLDSLLRDGPRFPSLPEPEEHHR